MSFRAAVRRVAGVSLALPLAFFGLGGASGTAGAESVTVPGCYGAASFIACDTTVEFVLPVGVETYQTVVPVCVGSCTDVPVTLVRTTNNADPHVCVTIEDRAGNTTTRECRPIEDGVPTVTRCASPQTGYVVRDGSGNTLLNACADRPDPGSVELCLDGDYVGVVVYDEYGNVVLDACRNVPPAPSVSTCGPVTKTVGVRVYDGDGNEIFSYCVPTTSDYAVGICDAPYYGVYVYDRYTGETVVNGCRRLNIPDVSVEPCPYGQNGVIVVVNGKEYNTCFIITAVSL